MRPKYKNELSKTLIQSQLELDSFKFEDGLEEDGYELSRITFLENGTPSQFIFLIRQNRTAFDKFDCRFVRYAPGMMLSELLPVNKWADINTICEYLKKWLLDIEKYVEDSDTIDLWEEYSKTHQFQQSQTIDFDDKSNFSYDEKQQILIALQNLEINISQHFEINEQQQKLISDGIKYLGQGVDRLNKVDWKGILIGQFFTLATALATNPHQFDALYNMFMKVIQIVYVLPVH